MEYQHWTIKEAMDRIGAKKLHLPAIQRKSNLHLLEGKENQNKLAAPFAARIKKELPKPADAKGFLPDVSLELSDFDQFFETRKALLKQKLAELLDVPVKAAA